MNIRPEIVALAETISDHRRHLHRYPELGFREVKTARYILDNLEGLDLTIQHPVAKTGIVATMYNGEGPCIALRADMDALPIQEAQRVAYRSVHDGVMHACAHDGHMAILLGAAHALHQMRDRFSGTIKLLFQPAEEGHGGAERMLAEGVLEAPRVESIFGLHLWNYQSLGTVGVKAGPVLAAADAFTMRVIGKGGHGATPHVTVDAVYVAAQLVVALQSIVSRNIDPLDAGVVTVGQMAGGSNFNVIADVVELRGTVRAYRESVRQEIIARLRQIASGVAAAYGAVIELEYEDGYPPTVNDASMAEVVERAARRVVGEGTTEPYLSMGGEDMAYYLHNVPGCFFFVGSAAPGESAGTVPHHCAHFDFDERAMLVGASVFIEIIMEMLGDGDGD